MIDSWLQTSLVHEAQAQASRHLVRDQPTPLAKVSNEPGLYLEGRFGIRIENLMLVVEQAAINHDMAYLYDNQFYCIHHTFDTACIRNHTETLAGNPSIPFTVRRQTPPLDERWIRLNHGQVDVSVKDYSGG